jgi:hypothetical protein
MNREDVIRMAREAGIPETATEGVFIANSDDLGRLIAAEREACALAAEAVVPRHTECGNKIAAAIRARGQG